VERVVVSSVGGVGKRRGDVGGRCVAVSLLAARAASMKGNLLWSSIRLGSYHSDLAKGKIAIASSSNVVYIYIRAVGCRSTKGCVACLPVGKVL
jgi:hypothetical protein